MFNELRKIYKSLSDDQSKYIFEQRLKYSLTGEKSYIRDMIQHEIERYSELDQMYCLVNWLKKRTGKIVLFGAGFAGFQIVTTLADYGLFVDYICDNNNLLWGKKKYDKEIISPEDLANMDNENLSVIIGVNTGRDDVIQQLKQIVLTGNIFIPIKDWWLGPHDQYYDKKIISSPTNNEVFIDGGALDGADTLRFLQWTHGKGVSYLIEPDRDNADNIKKRMSSFDGIYVLKKGLWDVATMLRFMSGENENSYISEEGDVEIQTVAIDEMEVHSPISFIKMDIEGSEEKALIGAKETIKKYKPKLAICIYHKPEDIIDLPLLILDLVPTYKLYLRHYSYTDTETVLYAVQE